jgi:hypothetical protein
VDDEIARWPAILSLFMPALLGFLTVNHLRRSARSLRERAALHRQIGRGFSVSIISDTMNQVGDTILGCLQTRRVILVFALAAFHAMELRADTITAGSCQQPAVQSAVDAAQNGDTVEVPAGTCSWNGTDLVVWSNKAIHLQGAGIGRTVITTTRALYITVTTQTGAGFRVSGFTWTHPTAAANFLITVANLVGPEFTKGWRIDHNRFIYGAAGQLTYVQGLTWGVIDHNIYDALGTGMPAAPLYIQGSINTENCSDANRLSGHAYWQQPMNLGTDEAVYFEDNIVNYGNGSGPPFVYDAGRGGSIVMRHNTVYNAYIQTHSARGCARGGMKYEVYNNRFFDSNSRFAFKRSGSGVIFNNQITGSRYGIEIDSQHIPGAVFNSGQPIGVCDGTNPLDKNIEPNGWPCLDQPGRGGQQASVPIYAWNNGSDSTCVGGGACDNRTVVYLNGPASDQAAYIKATPHSNGVVDFVNSGSTPKPGYTPFTYPHPVISGALVPPAAPTNVRVIGGS